MASTRLLLTTGEWVTVEGTPDHVSREIEDAARSTTGTLAWFKDVEDGQSVGLGPSHVVMVRPGDS